MTHTDRALSTGFLPSKRERCAPRFPRMAGNTHSPPCGGSRPRAAGNTGPCRPSRATACVLPLSAHLRAQGLIYICRFQILKRPPPLPLPLIPFPCFSGQEPVREAHYINWFAQRTISFPFPLPLSPFPCFSIISINQNGTASAVPFFYVNIEFSFLTRSG